MDSRLAKEIIAVIIPCHNEEKGIVEVINKFSHGTLARHGFVVRIIVIDNNSSDNTSKVASEAGATVIHESQKGKGHAIRAGLACLADDVDYVAMLDGDDTYSPKELLRMVEPLHNGFCEAVIGSRLGGKMHGDSMSKFNMLGNWVFTNLVRQVYRAKVTDVLTGYFAWNKDVIDRLRPHLKSEGFAIEMEMITKMARMGIDISSVPITYTQRAGESSLHPIKDGIRILAMFIRNLLWKEPPRTDLDTVQLIAEEKTL